MPWPASDLPGVFTSFRQKVERAGITPAAPLPAPARLLPPPQVPAPVLQAVGAEQGAASIQQPTLPQGTDARSSFPYGTPACDGSEAAALAHLAQYLARKLPHSYKATRNGLTGLDYSSKFSPWLATGALSPRQIYADLKTFERDHGANDGTYWLWFELLWRDYFRLLHLQYGAALYRARGLSELPPAPHNPRGFERWCLGGPMGWAFDGPVDEVSMSARFVGFDMTDFLDNPEIRTPMMLYLFHRVDELLNGQRVVVDIDEFWKALEDEAFMAFAKDGLKTFRKRNAFMVFGTQSPADALRSPIAHSIIEQTATKILLPNSQAKRSDYCDGLGLTDAEYRLIREDLTPESRCFLVKQGHTSIVAKLDLGGMSEELSVLSGRAETLAVMEDAIARAGNDPAAWLPLFYANERKS